jgi:hypothetical protein
MNHRDDDRDSADKCKYGEPASGQEKGSGRLTTAEKAFRAVTAVVVFGIPLVTGGAAVLGYGVHKAYMRITGRS